MTTYDTNTFYKVTNLHLCRHRPNGRRNRECSQISFCHSWLHRCWRRTRWIHVQAMQYIRMADSVLSFICFHLRRASASSMRQRIATTKLWPRSSTQEQKMQRFYLCWSWSGIKKQKSRWLLLLFVNSKSRSSSLAVVEYTNIETKRTTRVTGLSVLGDRV